MAVEPDYTCNAQRKQGEPGELCKKRAGWGTPHTGVGRCRLHGGNTKNQIAAAETMRAEREVATLGLPRDIDPHAALLEELHRTAGHVSWLQIKLAAVEEDRDLMQMAEVGDEDEGAAIRVEKMGPWYDMYQRERQHFAKVAKTCADVGIEERRVAIAEEQGRMFARAIEGILNELGVGDRPETPAVVRRHLTMVAGGAAS